MSSGYERPRYFLLDRMRDLYRAAIDELQRELAAEGVPLHPSEVTLLGLVPPEGCRASELVERVQLSKQMVSKMVLSLEQRGVLERHPDPRDGRAQIVRRTAMAEGRGYQIARRTLAGIEARWRDQLGAEGYARLHELLTRIAPEPGRL